MPDLPINQVLCGDCVELMKQLPNASIHAIVTDPPYGLEFMGEAWSKFKKVESPHNPKMKMDRHISTKPRAKDNPWEKVATKYGTPKKNPRCRKCNKLMWDRKKHKCKCEQPDFDYRTAEYPREYQKWTTAWAVEAYRILKPGGTMFVMGGTRTYHRLGCGIEDAGFLIKDCLLWCYNSGFPKAQDLGKMIDRRVGAERKKRPITYRKFEDITGGKFNRQDGQTESTKVLYKSEPTTDLAKKWHGWKVGGLKQSYEPIVWAVKPPEGSYTENVLKHGVGAVNVGGCRIPYKNEKDIEITARKNAKNALKNRGKLYGGYGDLDSDWQDVKGRYPSNMIRTDRFEDGYDKFYFVPKASQAERDEGLEGIDFVETQKGLDNRGRTIIREDGTPTLVERFGKNPVKNIHPTVKPIALGEHLIKLVTREGQIVLDMFCGSGSFLIAARRLNRHPIGTDNNPEYVEIAKRRLAAIPPPLEAFTDA